MSRGEVAHLCESRIEEERTIMKTIMNSELLEKDSLRGLKDKMKEIRESNSDSHFYSYNFSDGTQIYLEVTATQTMDSITQLEVEDQKKLLKALMAELPNPGDSIVIVDDTNDRGKRRTAGIVRLRGESENELRLLMTR